MVLTETVINTTNPFNGEKFPGTVGKPLSGVEIEVQNPEGATVATGETGEVMVKGPNVFQGYLNRPEANQEAFRNGWFATGDLGRWRPNGYLEISGRLKELIITGGFKRISQRSRRNVAARGSSGRGCGRWSS